MTLRSCASAATGAVGSPSGQSRPITRDHAAPMPEIVSPGNLRRHVPRKRSTAGSRCYTEISLRLTAGCAHVSTTLDPEALQTVALTVAGERSADAVLKRIVDGLAGQPGIALARVWLLRPGDICETCA